MESLKAVPLDPYCSLYMLLTYSVASTGGVNQHSYADDIQLCVKTKTGNMQSGIDNIKTSINNIDTWMSSIKST